MYLPFWVYWGLQNAVSSESTTPRLAQTGTPTDLIELMRNFGYPVASVFIVAYAFWAVLGYVRTLHDATITKMNTDYASLQKRYDDLLALHNGMVAEQFKESTSVLQQFAQVLGRLNVAVR